MGALRKKPELLFPRLFKCESNAEKLSDLESCESSRTPTLALITTPDLSSPLSQMPGASGAPEPKSPNTLRYLPKATANSEEGDADLVLRARMSHGDGSWVRGWDHVKPLDQKSQYYQCQSAFHSREQTRGKFNRAIQ